MISTKTEIGSEVDTNYIKNLILSDSENPLFDHLCCSTAFGFHLFSRTSHPLKRLRLEELCNPDLLIFVALCERLVFGRTLKSFIPRVL